MEFIHLFVSALARIQAHTRLILILVFLSLFVLTPLPHGAETKLTSLVDAAFPDSPKNVLILFSYHRAEWSDNVQKGIESVFVPYRNVNFFYEYMDTKHLKTNEYLKTLRKIYIEKYARVHIDLIICVDNNALALLANNAGTLFPLTPVVFCGINDYKPSLHANRPDVTGVVEYGDFADTLKIAFKARPRAAKFYIISDHTITGEINKRNLVDVLSDQAPGITKVETASMSYHELAAALQHASPQDIAFFVSYWKDGSGVNIEPWQLEQVFRKSAVPVFGRSEWMIGRGMVGGKCVTGFAQGEAAGRIALKILKGTPVSDLPVNTNSPNQYLFDYTMLAKFSIDKSILPATSLIFNRPKRFYQVAKPIVFIVLIFSVLLSVALVFLAVNVYRRMKAEKALRESEFRYRGMIENIQDTFYRTDSQNILAFISPSGARLLGYDSPQELLGIPDASLWKFPERWQYMLDRIKQEGVVRDYEAVLVKKDGSPIFVSTTSGCYFDADGRVLGIEGVFRDITERKEAEKALLAERQYLTDIVDSLPDATFIVDNDKRVILWNKAAEEMTGVDRKDLLGKGDYAYAVPFYGERRPILVDFLDYSDNKLEDYYLNFTRQNGKIYAESYNETLNNGQGAYLLGVAASLFNQSGERSGAVEVIKDITELKKSERNNLLLKEQLMQAQKIESIGRLAGGIAHDFNNMLGVILGHVELMNDDAGEDHSFSHNIEEIRKAAQHSADITRQLLAFARKQAISPRIIDLNDTVAGILTMLRSLIGESIELIWRPAANPGTVNMDPSQLKQILANLCVNARDAITDNGSVIIETREVVFDENSCPGPSDCIPGKYVQLAVCDDGWGMDQETIAHLFEPFFTTKEMNEGTGLGLAMVYGIVRQNRGFITVESEPEQGTTFRIYLPATMDAASDAAGEYSETFAEQNQKSILLVEDEPMVLNMTTKMLELKGYHVVPTKSPNEALLAAREYSGDIDLLITDVVMPEMNGKELAEKLTTFYPDVKILFMSGYPAGIFASRGILEESVQFLQKPFSSIELDIKIRDIFE